MKISVLLCLILLNVQAVEKKQGLIGDVVKGTGKALTNRISSSKCPVANFLGNTIHENIRLYVYRRPNPYTTEYRYYELTAELISSYTTGLAEFKIIIHGYGGNHETTPSRQLVKAYKTIKHNVRDINIIVVDYSYYAKRNCYISALKSMNAIAQHLNALIDRIIVLRNVSRSDFHLIGFNIGVHIAGIMGSYKTGVKYGRITALDAAHILSSRYRTLKQDDATFVDVLHTNRIFHGRWRKMGHVDFIANNGVRQPGCGLSARCSHVRAAEYFAESITCNNVSHKCIYAAECRTFLKYFCRKTKSTDLVTFGEYVNTDLRGIYYFITDKQSPFGLGEFNYTEKKRLYFTKKIRQAISRRSRRRLH